MTIDGTMKIKTLANFWIFEVKPTIDKALEAAPAEKLDWMPAPEMITLGNIFMHIAEASSWWIDRVIDGGDYFDLTPCQCPPKDRIAEMLEGHWQRLERLFSRSPEIFEKSYELKRKDKIVKYEGYWIMLHLFEHDIHHRSQANHYLRILGMTPPQI